MDVSIFKSIEEVVTYPGYLSPEDLDAISALHPDWPSDNDLDDDDEEDDWNSISYGNKII